MFFNPALSVRCTSPTSGRLFLRTPQSNGLLSGLMTPRILPQRFEFSHLRIHRFPLPGFLLSQEPDIILHTNALGGYGEHLCYFYWLGDKGRVWQGINRNGAITRAQGPGLARLPGHAAVGAPPALIRDYAAVLAVPVLMPISTNSNP